MTTGRAVFCVGADATPALFAWEMDEGASSGITARSEVIGDPHSGNRIWKHDGYIKQNTSGGIIHLVAAEEAAGIKSLRPSKRSDLIQKISI